MELQKKLFASIAIWLSGLLSATAQEPVKATAESAIGSTLSLSDEMRAFFNEGFDVQILLRNRNAPVGEQETPVIGNATLVMEGDHLLVQHIDIYPPKQNISLDKKLLAQLKSIGKQEFDAQGQLKISDSAQLQIDVLKMELFLDISAESFGVVEKPDSKTLAPSSWRQLSGLMRLNANAYHSRNGGSYSRNNTNYNFNLDTISGVAENHMLFSGTSYGNRNGKSNSKSKIDRWLYERDANGKTVVAGMMDSWNLQSLAQVTAVSANRIYGVSVGNRGASVVPQNDALVVPIVVYLPSAGEAHVFRDNQLISMQRFPMGNHSLNAANLPTGIYEVRVDIVVSGQKVSSRLYQVNKPSGGLRFGNSIGWQIWGGVMNEYNVRVQKNGYNTIETGKNAPLYGLSLSGALRTLDMNASLYQNRDTTVQESMLSWPILQSLRLRLQTLYASDGTRRSITSTTWQAPGNFMYLWGNYERGSEGHVLNYWSRNNYNVGGSLYLSSLIPYAGTLSFSYEKSLDSDNSRTLRSDYNQNLYSGRWGVLTMYAGINRLTSYYSNNKDTNNENYVNFNYSLPLRANFNLGYSHDSYGSNMALGADMSLDGVINAIGANITRNQPTQYDSTTSYNGYASYAARYGTGTLSLQGSSDTKSYSLQNMSTLGWNTQGVALGSGTASSGVIIQLPSDIEADQMEARIGQATYPLRGGRNLITLSPFKTYPVSIYDTGETELSYNIESGVSHYTLYPGNVVKLTPEVQQMVTVFGRLSTPGGEAISHAKISNHIGFTSSDDQGNFSIDISRETPQLVVESDQTGTFDINFNLKPRHQGALWVGNLVWTGAKIDYSLPESDTSAKGAPRF